jgi:hypothetical protein
MTPVEEWVMCFALAMAAFWIWILFHKIAELRDQSRREAAGRRWLAEYQAETERRRRT